MKLNILRNPLLTSIYVHIYVRIFCHIRFFGCKNWTKFLWITFIPFNVFTNTDLLFVSKENNSSVVKGSSRGIWDPYGFVIET